MRPWVGLRPTTPQYPAGRSTEPTVWEPSASGTIRAATAAAGPLEDPPGVCSGFHGLRVGLGSRNAKAVVVTLPRPSPPAARSRATDVASAEGTRWAKGPAPAVVGRPAASKMSLRANG